MECMAMPLSIPFEKLLGEVAEGITITDPNQPDNPLVYINAGFTRMTGYTAEDALGRNCRFLQGPETDSRASARISYAVRQQQRCVVELLNYRKDGAIFWNNVSISPVYNAQGELAYYIGVQMDVTERKLREEKERQFADNIAHELKTPLSALSGLSETLLRQSTLTAELRNGLYRSILSQTQRLISLVDQLLLNSKCDFAQYYTQRKLLNLYESAAAALDTAGILAAKKAVRLSSQLPDVPVWVMGDGEALMIALMNLLANAIKFTPGGGSVNLVLREMGDLALIEVSDTGIGIAPEHQARIFDRFYKVDQARSREQGGTGLGLAITQEIIRGHEGTIGVCSAEEQGSTFTISLPLSR
jgi:PAS domain S-box-containing protein